MDLEYAPLTGDADLLKAKALEYQRIADAITASTSTLDDIVDQVDQKSLAMDATRELAKTVADDIRQASTRYRATGDALLAYSAALRTALADGDAAAARVARADEAYADAHHRHSNATHDLHRVTGIFSSATPEEITDARHDERIAATHLSTATTERDAARAAWVAARDAKDAAAQVAIDAIHDVVDGPHADGLNDGWSEYLGKALDVLKMVCDIAAVLSIFLAWVPVLGQVLLVLAAIGAIIAVVDAAVKYAKGEGSLGSLLLAIGGAVLSIYGGKLITLGAKAVKANAARQLGMKFGAGYVRVIKELPTLKVARAQLLQTGGQKLLTALKSPFVRTESQKALMFQFKNHAKTAGDILGEIGGKQFANPFKLKNMIGINDDVWDLFKVIDTQGSHLNAQFYNQASGLFVAAIAQRTTMLTISTVKLGESLSGGNALDAGTSAATYTGSHLDGPWGKAAAVPRSSIKGVDAFMQLTE